MVQLLSTMKWLENHLLQISLLFLIFFIMLGFNMHVLLIFLMNTMMFFFPFKENLLDLF